MKILKIQAITNGPIKTQYYCSVEHNKNTIHLIYLYVYSTYNLHKLFISINLIIILGFWLFF